MALQTLGDSVWCKRWHRGGCCFRDVTGREVTSCSASVFNETARPLAPSPDTSAAARTSSLPAPQLAPAQHQIAFKTRSFLVLAHTGTDPIAHLANITGTAMSLASDIDTFIEGCRIKTIALRSAYLDRKSVV